MKKLETINIQEMREAVFAPGERTEEERFIHRVYARILQDRIAATPALLASEQGVVAAIQKLELRREELRYGS